MKITDLKCAVIGNNPVIRILTDDGIVGIAAGESNKAYLKPMILFYKDFVVGKDPTDVERVMLSIRRLGAFKPWGTAVSMIEMALWDIAGQAAGVPIYKLLGGKIRDRVRVYNGSIRFPLEGNQPEDYADAMARMKALPQKFSLIKQAVGFHDAMFSTVEDFYYGTPVTEGRYPNRGPITEKGFKHLISCI